MEMALVFGHLRLINLLDVGNANFVGQALQKLLIGTVCRVEARKYGCKYGIFGSHAMEVYLPPLQACQSKFNFDCRASRGWISDRIRTLMPLEALAPRRMIPCSCYSRKPYFCR